MMTVPLFKPLPKHAVQKQTNSSQDEYQADTNTTELKPSNTLVSKNYAYNSRAALKLEQGLL